MPSSLLTLDVGFPTFGKEESTDEKFFKVENYLQMLMEELRYSMFNIGEKNFNSTELQTIGETISNETLYQCELTYQKIEDMDGYVKTTELNAGISSYIDSAAGTAKVVSACSATYQTKDAMSEYTKTVALGTEIGSYIDSETGTAKIITACSGTYQTQSAMAEYTKTASLGTEIGSYIDSETGTAKVITACSATYQTQSAMSEYTKTNGLNTVIGSYIDSQDGTAKVITACSATYQTQSAMSEYTKTASLGTEIGSYIDSETGTAKVVTACSATYQTIDGMNQYTKTTGLSTVIGNYIDSQDGTAKVITACSGTYQTQSAMSDYVLTANLNSNIGTYIDSQTGTAKVISACSATYQTQAGMSSYASIAYVDQEVGQATASLNLAVSSSSGSSTFTLKDGTTTLDTKTLNITCTSANIIGTLGSTQIANGAITTAKISAGAVTTAKIAAGAVTATEIAANTITTGKLNFTPLTSTDVGSSGTTSIDGARIKTGTISADRISTSIAQVNSTLSIGSSSSSGRVNFYSDSGYILGASNGLTLGSGGWTKVSTAGNFDVNCSADANIGAGNYVYLKPGSGCYTAFYVGSSQVALVGASSMRPASDAGLTLGTSSYRWGQIYSSSSSISTSDRNYKTNITYGLERFDGFFDSLKPASFKMINGTSGRTHCGMIAQDVEDSLYSNGFDSFDYACFSKSEKVYYDDKNHEITIPGEYNYGLRYEEFVPLLIDQTQRLKARVSELERMVGSYANN